MFRLVVVVLLGTVVTVNSDKLDVELSINDSGNDKGLTCRARGFNTSDIILNIKKNHCVLTEDDGVKSDGVRTHGNTYWRRDHVTIPQSEVSHYSCEVVHAVSRFRVEKLWDPDSDGRGRIILSEFIATNQPEVELSINDSGNDKALTCRARGFITSDIILNIKKNHYVLTKEDGVKTSGVKPQGNIYWRRDSVIVPQSEVSHYSCEVIHAASRFRVEKVWDPESDGRGRIISSEFIETNQPEVEMHSEIVDVGTERGHHRILTCRVKGFNTSDVILNIKKNHCVQTKEDGVKTSGVQKYDDTYWRRDRVIILKSEVSNFSCEVIDAASRFRVEKFWDPESDGGRIISSECIETSKPHVKMFAENSKVQTNIILTCLVSGFYPNNITVNMKRNGRILTREDGVESSGVCSNGNGTFQRRDSVEIKKSDESDYSCEVIYDASGSRVEKIWDHSLPQSGGAAVTTGAVIGGVLVLVVVVSVVLVVLRRQPILGR